MILVTGASGTVGRALVRQLSDRGAAFNAMVRKVRTGMRSNALASPSWLPTTPISLGYQQP